MTRPSRELALMDSNQMSRDGFYYEALEIRYKYQRRVTLWALSEARRQARRAREAEAKVRDLSGYVGKW